MRNELCIQFLLHSALCGLLRPVLVVQSDSSRREGPAMPLLHTLGVYQSVAEGAAQCCESDLQGVGLLHQQRWQLISHPALSHHLHWVKRACTGAGLLDKFIQSLPTFCQDAAAPADCSTENGWCHHRVLESPQECLLHSTLWSFLRVVLPWSECFHEICYSCTPTRTHTAHMNNTI